MFNQEDIKVMAKTIYGEARGEFFKYGYCGLICVGNVIHNRFLKQNYYTHSKSIAEICLQPNQFSCWNSNDVNKKLLDSLDENSNIFKKCFYTTKCIIKGKIPDLTGGCTHYHARGIRPFWSLNVTPTIIVGNHIFYKL